jgi:DNA-binding CsgD family transcriptional regulator
VGKIAGCVVVVVMAVGRRRDALVEALEGRGARVGVAASEAEALDRVTSRVDLALLVEQGAEVASPRLYFQLARRSPESRVLAVSSRGTRDPVSVEDRGGDDALLAEVREVVASVAFTGFGVAGTDDAADRIARIGRLSPREREVLGHILRGRVNREIAALLGVTPRTVKFHVAGLCEKLGLRTRRDLMALLVRSGGEAAGASPARAVDGHGSRD